MEINWESQFENSYINLSLYTTPVSLQNKSDVKENFKQKVHEIIKECPFIITSVAWIEINYYCENIKRLHNFSSYDMDNIVKPILDSISGKDGLIIDDYLFDRVIVNWIDKAGDDMIEIHIEYPDLYFLKKENLCFYKKGQWCLPFPKPSLKEDLCGPEREIITIYLDNWIKIQTEDDYYDSILPIQRFLPYNKIANKGFEIIEINGVQN